MHPQTLLTRDMLFLYHRVHQVTRVAISHLLFSKQILLSIQSIIFVSTLYIIEDQWLATVHCNYCLQKRFLLSRFIWEIVVFFGTTQRYILLGLISFLRFCKKQHTQFLFYICLSVFYLFLRFDPSSRAFFSFHFAIRFLWFLFPVHVSEIWMVLAFILIKSCFFWLE